ncbi:OmpH family outer membrane protein [Pseudodesulfovibrio tunisiensis]|uniref:OmpH family outer membrane protein n=1 Tax=Pseudodesulfovibrio tunisiensis TaxID=463192 RepID=UPI001FB56BFA|nr:OmpH family outer membrane protein [Pseudodesulfovibrio tunisiensis]
MKLFRTMTVLLVFSVLLVPAARAQMSKVGFLNPQRVINESKIGRVAQDDLARLGREKDRQVAVALEKVQALKGELASGEVSVAEQSLREAELRRAARDYEAVVERSNLEIQEEERKLIRFIMHRADSILKALAEERGFTLILTDPEIVGYVVPQMDVTDRVISELDKML